LIAKAGAFYTIADQKFQGKEKAGQFLTDNPNVQQILETEIQMKIKDIRMGKNVIPLEQLDAIKVNPEEDEDDGLELE
jgi:hypothetical protein